MPQSQANTPRSGMGGRVARRDNAATISAGQDEKPLSLKEVVAELGLSETTIRRRINDGTIPVIQLGGRGKKILIRRSALVQLSAPVAAAQQDDHADEANIDAADRLPGCINRPKSGPVPAWMHSPLMNKSNSTHNKSENIENAKKSQK